MHTHHICFHRGVSRAHPELSRVHEGVFSTSKGYLEFIGGCSVHHRDTIIHVCVCGGGGGGGDTMSTLGDTHFIKGIYTLYITGSSVNQCFPCKINLLSSVPQRIKLSP